MDAHAPADHFDIPYTEGRILTMRIHRTGNKSNLPGLFVQNRELRGKIVKVREHSSSSTKRTFILELELQHEEPNSPAVRAVLKVYDRQFTPNFRAYHNAGQATSETEKRYTDFVRQGAMPQFSEDYEQGDLNKYDGADMPKTEALCYIDTAKMHDTELKVYDRLADLQGSHVPTLLADVRLTPQYASADLDDSLKEYLDIKALLLECIPGFPLVDLATEAPESDWPMICDQAMKTVRYIAEHDFICGDRMLHDIVVRRTQESVYHTFFVDFALCQFREAGDSEEFWRGRKKQANEEGAVGYGLNNVMSYAKGKGKGKYRKRYKGNDPLPWGYVP
ncbi:unnamed protein product [Periconia digitata]|uniref:Uncharacterized protein n=1 Tax=Periconia digitata TaxID=1303443 RepID=A0A9W4UL73_9PLEO|nr:unnamed protein product [Periconia digitata]